jgi:hypothetical protein
MTCTQTVTLGAYLLGALEPPERYEFESHIAQCDSCRTELIRLAPLPGMLNQISVEDFDEGLPAGELYPTAPMPIQTLDAPAPQMLAPPPELLVPPSPPDPSPPPAEPAPPGRSRAYRLVAAAALVVLVAVGAAFGWGALRGATPEPGPENPGITWSASAPQTDIRADVRLVDHEWGTEIGIRMANMPPDRRCYAVVYDHYGNRETAGWWGTDHDANVEIPASTSIRRSWIDRIEFKLDDKETFLTIKAPVR